jgi:predicted RNA-binding Zn-ribbon protein involved in translation (DUF1610 family)
MSCRLCGAETSRRLCRQCEIEERAEERARARKRLEEESDDGDEDDGQETLADGGTVEPNERDRVQVCPDCGDARIRRRAPDHPASTAVGDEQYRCRVCGFRFDSPAERTRAGPSGLNGLAKRLVETEEDDLRTDGGETIGDLDAIEAERRARAAARALDQWSRIARLDLLDIVREETPIGEWSSSTPSSPLRDAPSSAPHAHSTYHLVCRDCPFEAVSTSADARERLHRARDVHRAAFDHDVVVESIATPADRANTRLKADGGSDR